MYWSRFQLILSFHRNRKNAAYFRVMSTVLRHHLSNTELMNVWRLPTYVSICRNMFRVFNLTALFKSILSRSHFVVAFFCWLMYIVNISPIHKWFIIDLCRLFTVITENGINSVTFCQRGTVITIHSNIRTEKHFENISMVLHSLNVKLYYHYTDNVAWFSHNILHSVRNIRIFHFEL